MNGPVRTVAGLVCSRCHTERCGKDGCSISMQGIPAERVLVDMDCRELRLRSDRSRCDYLFVGEENSTAWVAPIELKSGGFKPVHVLAQLQGGADAADGWLPRRVSFKLVPVLAHGRGVHRKDFTTLRKHKVTLRGQQRQVVLIRCGEQLGKALGRRSR